MARMIPPDCSGLTPAGERELFNKLKLDPNTEEWTALHSLDLKKHQTKVEGELDMVILVPNVGILCIEVKGCDVSRTDGKWIYPYETSIEGPFKQASRSMHSLRNYVISKDSNLKDILFFSCVIFTRINFEEKSPEWHPWQVIGKNKFLRQPISMSVINVLEHAHQHLLAVHGNGWYPSEKSRPTLQQVNRITNLLRDNFEYRVSPRTDIETLEERIIHYTEEQFEALDLLEDNARVIFKGPAGTGKTFLALEAAKRAAADNKKTLLISFNSLLGEWLRAAVDTFSTRPGMIDCKTYHSLLLKISGARLKNNDPEFWKTKLPNLAIDKLLNGSDLSQSYDVIIVDEAQDLMREDYLDVLDLILIGGLSGGNWAFFGDFEKQAIYSDDPIIEGMRSLDLLSARSPIHAKFTLRNNCRNALPIADLLSLTCKLNPGYKKVLNNDLGFETDTQFYVNENQQLSQLEATLDKLLLKFKHSEILVLSTKSDQNCVIRSSSPYKSKHKLKPIRDIRQKDEIAYTSIYSFKGMESAAVVLTDIEDLSSGRSQALLYVGISRARVALVILMNEVCREQYDKLLDGRYA
jgi:hypothetical protein